MKNSTEVWLRLVERFGRDEEAVGSNPVTSTTKTGFRKESGFFFVYYYTGWSRDVQAVGFYVRGSAPCLSQLDPSAASEHPRDLVRGFLRRILHLVRGLAHSALG